MFFIGIVNRVSLKYWSRKELKAQPFCSHLTPPPPLFSHLAPPPPSVSHLAPPPSRFSLTWPRPPAAHTWNSIRGTYSHVFINTLSHNDSLFCYLLICWYFDISTEGISSSHEPERPFLNSFMSLLQMTLTSLLTVIGDTGGCDTGGCDGRVQPVGAAFSGLATTEQRLHFFDRKTLEK